MDQVTAADGFVFTMLGVIVVSFGVVAMLLLSIRRNLSRRDLMVEDLLEEVAAFETLSRQKSSVKKTSEMTCQAWEKDGDWWKV